MMDAPFFSDIARGPPGGRAYWRQAGDDLRVRIGHWPLKGAKGTVILLPGRTEFIEKYGHTAADLGARAYGTLTIDWRGQGLSDRMSDDAMSGHVDRFGDYQDDLAALMAAAQALDLPRPWHLLAHSMGGCIGLRGAMEGLPVASCAFTAPMWGIEMKALLRPVAWSLSWASRHVGLGHVYAPGTVRGNYLLSEPFETNALTRDADMHAHMIAQLRAHPELAIGGPSLRWLFEALRECRALARAPSPELPCLTIVGSDEDIVSIAQIEDRIARWPGARLKVLEGARHEVLMDTPQTRQDVTDMLAAFWNGA
ncbi:alpha/beta hydrolase [Pelagivirga sediminicola]|uniref:Alpha/beta hydrolase n=1 Tax=Pelagivirga sediminicola TaxID=2170575 RepID=A0A2T7GBZ8_9RHOB|nr:alpha/beta hydrolase [Pelagivirga sediminicola]PVA11941.1 alpha/beta hydrolase [Pelagivirga sediminicola]